MGKSSYITATDQFCGAGGSTSGAKAAGVEVKMALNHWKLAIETHNTNHPDTDHDCTDIQACDPRRYPSTNILITSPECTNHSLAKGKKRKHRNNYKLWNANPITEEEERSRATMWDVPRFAEYHDYDIVIVENVTDARDWRMWDAWLMAMHSLGYVHKTCYFNSRFFHPCPQSRDRMYVVFWKKGNHAPDLEFRPVAPCPKCGNQETYQWFKRPDRKFGKYDKQYLYRCSKCNDIVTPYYYCAFNAIDWSIPITRIGDRKRPLADKTIQRIKYGLDKYGDQQMIITGRYTSGIECRVKRASEHPLPTQPGDASHFLLSPVLIGRTGYDLNGRKTKPAHLPLTTQTTRQDATILIPPSIIELRRTGKSRPIDEAISTITAGGNNHALCLHPSIVELRGQSKAKGSVDPISTCTSNINHALLVGNYSPGWTRPLSEPAGTMTTTAQQGIVTHENLNSFLSYYYGNMQASDMSDPMFTVSTRDRASLVRPSDRIDDCYYRCLKPNEVQKAMAFGDDYVVLGNSKQKVKQLGNAVTPPVMEWLVKQCVASLEN